jgi:hypothetical protein
LLPRSLAQGADLDGFSDMAQGGDNWWRDGIFYQIYPRSFQDSDGDGVGDLAGILRRLPYVKSLGVDATPASIRCSERWRISTRCSAPRMTTA